MGLFKKFATVASGTMASRLFGFLREMLMAASLGTGPIADAFNAAFRFPNSFRRLFAEGALSSAFVPLFTKHIENKGIDNARDFASDVFGVLLSALLALTTLALIFMPILVRYIIAPGFVNDPIKYNATVQFAFIMFPYLACMSLTAIISGMLNSMNRYFAAAIAPIFLNAILIGVLIYSYYYKLNYWKIGLYLSEAVLIAGITQLLVVYISAYRANIRIKLKLPKINSEIRKMLSLAVPAAISGGITQINLLINTSIASTDSGAISSLAYADRLYQLPLGIIGISVGTVLLPELSKALRSNNTEHTTNIQHRSIEFALFLALPASIALIGLSEPIIRLLLEHGNFNADSTIRVAHLLKIYGIGLPSFILIKALIPNYFAHQDTKTPLRFAAIAVAINICLAFSLFPYLSAYGIAIAEITASWLNCTLLFLTLVKRKKFIIKKLMFVRIAKFLLSSLLMGIFLIYSSRYFAYNLSNESSLTIRIETNLLIISTAILLYFLFVLALRAVNIKSFKGKE